ncbi:AAA family ATPase [Sphingobium lignivorans]|uniref:ATP-dependent endonuclease of OLD family n=1 Tax=Sphingobium lignivorans TaxID=2735886 RepID=A0ABR6NB88_9SPHN|nr:AAA family ATPase [Sphingobium lignivorans]MBB5984530.1 putative ATP-dependent endonuclease of OLD family [Sphingobium lignivorans]
MRIEYLQVSNILSFSHVPNITDAEKITFDDGLNIIIGENGSGKSTALEIINFLFKHVFYRQFVFNSDLFEQRHNLSSADRGQILQPVDQRDVAAFRLEANWQSGALEQRIRIALRLDEIDHGNIKKIKDNLVNILEHARIYSTYAPSVEGGHRDLYTVDVVIDRARNTFSIHLQNGGEDFGFRYLTDYNYFKEAIALHNHLNPERTIMPLLESFTLISSYRNYNAFQPSISLRNAAAAQQIQQIRSQDFGRSLNAIDQQEPSIFGLVRLQVAERHYDLMSQAKTKEQCEDEANTLPFIVAINKRLQVINLRCEIRLQEQRTWDYSFHFYDTRRNQPIGDINSLSAGQKAIIHLVMEAYGRGDLKGGVIIIDEPEIHLHYQFQHEYLQVIRDLNRVQKCQYILVTHSEALINSSTINSVRRFALSADGRTQIHAPTLNADQKSLIKILDNTRSTYAFFAKKVVLVEGDSDRYFIKAVIQERYRQLDQEIAVLHIGGKGEFQKWRDLFEAFGLTVYAIADFDYIINLHYSTAKGARLKTQAEIAAFKVAHPDWQAKITDEIANRTFILSEGDLEWYLSIGKDLDQVINFCQNRLAIFLADDADPKSVEVRAIMEAITS